MIDQFMRACPGARYALVAGNIPKSVRPRPIHAWRSMMVGSSSPTPVRSSRGDTFYSRKAPSGAGFEHFKAERTVEPTVKILRLRQHRHAVVVGLNPDRGAGTMIVQERTHSRVRGSFQRSQRLGSG